MSNITVYTDASWDRGKGGGAFWARGDVGRATGYFPIPMAEDSGECEAIAMLHSAILVIEDPEFEMQINCGARLILVGDCRPALDYITHGKGAFDRNPTCRMLSTRLREYAVDFKCNWVKAHQGGKNQRSWLNEWCDKHARKARLLNG